MLPSSIPIPIPGGLHDPLPLFVEVAQKLDLNRLNDIDDAVAKEFSKFSHIDIKEKVIAIGVGRIFTYDIC